MKEKKYICEKYTYVRKKIYIYIYLQSTLLGRIHPGALGERNIKTNHESALRRLGKSETTLPSASSLTSLLPQYAFSITSYFSLHSSGLPLPISSKEAFKKILGNHETPPPKNGRRLMITYCTFLCTQENATYI